jgi:hypothetical protein
MKKLFVAIVCLATITGCSWLTPGHIQDVTDIVKCVLANETLPVAQIGEKCGVEDLQEILDILAAHRDAEAREKAAGQACAPDSGKK